AAAQVLTGDLDVRPASSEHPRGMHVPADPEANAAPPNVQGGDDGEDEDPRREHVEVTRADQAGRDPEGGAGGNCRPASLGWHQAFPRTGTGTSLSTSARTDCGVRPDIAASADTIRRWDITGTTRVFTSSGIT